jgi:hypothetical protein
MLITLGAQVRANCRLSKPEAYAFRPRALAVYFSKFSMPETDSTDAEVRLLLLWTLSTAALHPGARILDFMLQTLGSLALNPF